MKIIIFNFEDSIFNFQRSNSTKLCLVAKLNSKKEVIAFGVSDLDREECYIVNFSTTSLHEYINKLVTSLNSLEKIFVLDSKYFYKSMSRKEILDISSTNIVYDVSLIASLENIAVSKNHVLNSSTSEDTKKIRFLFDRISGSRLPWEIVPEFMLNRFIYEELSFIKKLCKINIHNNLYTNVVNKFLATLAIIEKNSLIIDRNLLHNTKINKVFEFIENKNSYNSKSKTTIIENNNTKAYIEYNLFSTHTNRIISSFNTLSRLDRKFINSGFYLGSIVEIDMNAFEIKALLDYLSIENKSKDLYEDISIKLNRKYSREEVKSNLIKWIYGSSSYIEEIVSAIDNSCLIEQRIEKIRNSIDKNYITSRIGSKIFYSSIEETKKKFINGIIQNYSSFIMMFIVTKLEKALNKLESNIIAIVYDAIFLDVKKEEHEIVVNICLETYREVSKLFLVEFSSKIKEI